MLANKRIISAKGLVNIPIISTGIIMGQSAIGTGGIKICFQYALFPLALVTIIVIADITSVNAIFPERLALKGKKGTKPIKLFTQIRKNIVNKNGIYFWYLGPIFGLAISSLTNTTNGSIKEANPFGTLFPFL